MNYQQPNAGAPLLQLSIVAVAITIAISFVLSMTDARADDTKASPPPAQRTADPASNKATGPITGSSSAETPQSTRAPDSKAPTQPSGDSRVEIDNGTTVIHDSPTPGVKIDNGTTTVIHESTPPPAATPPAKLTPADRPAPKGQDAAVKLYSQRKFALAAKEFQKFISDGTADVNTHAYLAYCLYNTRQYRAALKQFDWVDKYSTKSISLQMSAARSSAMIRNYMAGVCPGNCLKANDPRWQHLAGQDPKKLWIQFTVPGGWAAISNAHIGQVVSVENGKMVNKGVCPICGGTGTVAVLHDGDPVPK